MTQFNQVELQGYVAVENRFLKELGWPVRSLSVPDTGIDRFVEVSKPISTSKTQSEASGRFIGLQVKSGDSYFQRMSNGGYEFSLKSSEYDYWVNCSVPVIVVLYRSSDDLMVWEVINSSTAISTGKNFKCIVQANQVLDASAEAKLRALAAPLSASQLLLLKQQDMERKDPRLAVKITATDQGESIRIAARDESVAVEMRLRANEEKVRRMVRDGQQIVLSPDEQVEFKGSKLLEDLVKSNSGPVALQMGRKLDAWMVIDALGRDGASKCQLPLMECSVCSGTENGTVEGQLGDGVVKLSIRMPNDGAVPSFSKFIQFGRGKWLGQRLQKLALFPEVKRFVECVAESKQMAMRLNSPVGELFRTTITIHTDFSELLATVQVLHKARSIAEKFGLNPTLKRFGVEEVVQIHRIYELLSSGESVQDAPQSEINGTMTISREISATPILSTGKPFQVAIRKEDEYLMPLLGEWIDVSPISIELTEVTCPNGAELASRTLGDRVPARFIGTDECKVVFRRENIINFD